MSAENYTLDKVLDECRTDRERFSARKAYIAGVSRTFFRLEPHLEADPHALGTIDGLIEELQRVKAELASSHVEQR